AADSIPSIQADRAVDVARLVQKVLNEQGVTMVMDARVAELQLDAFRALQEQGELTLRVQAAREITPDDAPDVASVPQAVQNAVAFAERYHQPEWGPEPGIAVKNIKMFVDGVLQFPTMTASLLKPYRINHGTPAQPDWRETENYG
ncbi:amidohydrolase, partial [Klebsiella pneumoniae]|nr:amidohydrolase [Klebsiella pneumoniae]